MHHTAQDILVNLIEEERHKTSRGNILLAKVNSYENGGDEVSWLSVVAAMHHSFIRGHVML